MKERMKLISTLSEVIRHHNNERETLKHLEGLFNTRGVNSGEIDQYWTGSIRLDAAPDIYLLLIAKGLYDYLGEPSIKPEQFFTPVEINDGLKWRREIEKETVELPLEIVDVIAVTNNQWITSIDIQTLKRWYQGIPLVYNYETQRHPRIKRRPDGSIIPVKSVNPKAIASITERITKKRQFPDTITLNLLADGSDQFIYDRKRTTLTIISGELDILDGDHRLSGILEYLNNYPEGNMAYELRITNFDRDTARRFQNQVQTVNRFSKAQKEILQVEKPSNRCVNRILSGQSDFGKVITENIGYIRAGEALVSFVTLSTAMKYIFDLGDGRQILNKEIYNIADWVSEVLDEIIGLYPEEFIEQKSQAKEVSVMTHENTFIGYIGLAKALMGLDKWRALLSSALASIDFGVDNPAWADLRIDAQRSSLNKSYVLKVANYFADKVGC